MNFISIFLALFCFLNLSPITLKNVVIDPSISEEIKLDIITSVKKVIRSYEEDGNFWNEEAQSLSDRKYLNFIALFAGQAECVDDINWSKEAMHFSEYAQLIYDKLQTVGFIYHLESINIESIGIDDSGFYVVDLSVRKRVYSGINNKQSVVELKSGRVIKLDMRIDLPDYLISDARIQYIRERKKMSVSDLIRQPLSYLRLSSEKRQ